MCNKHFQRMLPLQHLQTAMAKSSLFRSHIWAGWQKQREHTSHWSLSLSNTKAKGHFPKGQLQVRTVTLPSSADIGTTFPIPLLRPGFDLQRKSHLAEISAVTLKRWSLMSPALSELLSKEEKPEGASAPPGLVWITEPRSHSQRFERGSSRVQHSRHDSILCWIRT